MNEVMRASQAAEYLQISKWLVYELAKKGQLPHIRLGNRILFRKSTIDEWLMNQENESIKNLSQQETGKLRRING